ADLADAGPAVVVDLAPQERVRLRDHAVRVHIDGLHAATAHHHLAAAAARHRREPPRARRPAALSARGSACLGSDLCPGPDNFTGRERDGCSLDRHGSPSSYRVEATAAAPAKAGISSRANRRRGRRPPAPLATPAPGPPP